jgi:mannose-6-phosphate isomerase-like protein (cupin superfamily)
MTTYKKFKLNDDITMQIISVTDEMMSARFWFSGKGFPSTHQHVNEELNVVLNGEFVATNGSQTFPVHAGQAVAVASAVEHNMACQTPTGEMISTWTPARQDLLQYAQTE